ncbi:hypothetical protein TARUN_3897 [Trichoderma arundinaceum]|uniref:Zn(2)-C6 fungal-type domain-containing protein n=1 Tax=Trichoderma arundinaceum TaxID=490622 RepID=A0A395NQX1_TRIAR|nr:hypothetical protein TARUN_3897 [Trichoderma arundinaceum]
MDESSDAGMGEGVAGGPFSLPCDVCRRRKVRCSKTWPCSNCERNSVRCTYDNSRQLLKRPSKVNDLNNRVARLESIIQYLSRQDRQERNETDSSSRVSTNSVEAMARNIRQSFKWDEPENQVADGTLVYDTSCSRYLSRTFWATMYDEIANLKTMLDDEKNSPGQHLSLPGTVILQPDAWDRPYVTEETSDFLVRAFINYVDPFIRLIHVPKLLLDLNHFRRKVLRNPELLEIELYAIYGLATLSLTAQEVVELGLDKSAFVARCKRYVENGLTWLKVTTTHDVCGLRILLHFITLMFWTGEMVHANSLLGVAISVAHRLGVHRAQFHLLPFQAEMRRRMWHHIELLDSWSIENLGTETLIVPGLSDAVLPLNVDDASWDISPFASSIPEPQTGFTNMTIALIQYEVAALAKTVLKHGASKKGTGDTSFCDFHAQLFQQSKEKLETTYLKHLDRSDIKQRLALHIAELRLSQIKLTQKRMGAKVVRPPDHADPVSQYEIEYDVFPFT